VRLKEKDCRIGCGGHLFPPPHDWRTWRRLTRHHMADKIDGASRAQEGDPLTAIAVTTRSDGGDPVTELGLHLDRRGNCGRSAFTARSRHGASNELARQLVAAGLADQPMAIHCRGLAGTITWPSFYAAATWTFSEGDRPLRRIRYKERPEGPFLRSDNGENAFRRAPDDVVVIPEPDSLKTECRKCVSCDRDFLPARPWSRFCSTRLSTAG
jgi:hypothetical protein